MKYYDKSMYQTEQHVRIIVTILIAFIIGFLIGYWCRGTELINTKTEEKNQIANAKFSNKPYGALY